MTGGKLPSGRHGLDRESVVRSQRSRLTAAMIAAVADRGYAATTVADVTGRAGVSRATFYELFEDKEDCFLTAYDELIGAVVAGFEGAYREADGWPDKVRNGLEALLALLAANPDSARVAIVEVIGAGPLAGERLRDAAELFLPFVEEGRREADGADVLTRDLSRAVVGGIASTIVDEIQAGRTAALPTLLPELLYTALVPFLGHERARAEMSAAAASR